MDELKPVSLKKVKPKLKQLFVEIEPGLLATGKAKLKKLPSGFQVTNKNLVTLALYLVATMPEAEIEKYLKAEIK